MQALQIHWLLCDLEEPCYHWNGNWVLPCSVSACSSQYRLSEYSSMSPNSLLISSVCYQLKDWIFSELLVTGNTCSSKKLTNVPTNSAKMADNHLRSIINSSDPSKKQKWFSFLLEHSTSLHLKKGGVYLFLFFLYLFFWSADSSAPNYQKGHIYIYMDKYIQTSVHWQLRIFLGKFLCIFK